VPRVLSPPLPFALAAGAAAILAAATPAGASEGPPVPPGVPPVNVGITPVGIPQLPVPAAHARPRIRGARIVPRHIRSGRRAKLRLRLSSAGRLRLTVTRMSRPHRGRIALRHVTVPKGRVTIRLPKRAHGHALRSGRYRVAVVLTDARGGRSRKVRRSFVVR
jgi:hypothetical protein